MTTGEKIDKVMTPKPQGDLTFLPDVVEYVTFLLRALPSNQKAQVIHALQQILKEF